MRHQLIECTGDRCHFVFDRLLHFHQTAVQFVSKQFTNRTDTSVTKVVTIIDVSLSVLNLDQIFDSIDQIFCGQNSSILRYIQSQLVVHFHTTDFSQIISFRIEKELVQKCFCSFRCNRFTRPHHFIDTNSRKNIFIFNLFSLFQKSETFIICNECINDRLISTISKVIDNFNFVNSLLYHLFQFCLIKRGNHIIKHFSALLINYCSSEVSLHQRFKRIFDPLKPLINQLLRFFLRKALSGIDHYVTIHITDIMFSSSRKITRVKLDQEAVVPDHDFFGRIEELDNILFGVVKCSEKNRYRNLSSFVNTCIEDIFCIIFKIEPASSVRNDLG